MTTDGKRVAREAEGHATTPPSGTGAGATTSPTLEYTVGSFQVGGRPIENFDGDGRPMDAAATAQWIADVDEADRLLIEEIARVLPR